MNKNDSNEPTYHLKIESGVGGGSISLERRTELIDEWIGHSQIERNDYLIKSLSRVLERNNLQISEICKITYSNSPTTLTGYRIITSIVKGLSIAHNIETIEKNLFESIMEFYSDAKEIETIIVLPGNKENIEFARCSGKKNLEFDRSNALDEILSKFELMRVSHCRTLIPVEMFKKAKPDVFNKLKNNISTHIVDLGENLSVYQ